MSLERVLYFALTVAVVAAVIYLLFSLAGTVRRRAASRSSAGRSLQRLPRP